MATTTVTHGQVTALPQGRKPLLNILINWTFSDLLLLIRWEIMRSIIIWPCLFITSMLFGNEGQMNARMNEYSYIGLGRYGESAEALAFADVTNRLYVGTSNGTIIDIILTDSIPTIVGARRWHGSGIRALLVKGNEIFSSGMDNKLVRTFVNALSQGVKIDLPFRLDAMDLSQDGKYLYGVGNRPKLIRIELSTNKIQEFSIDTVKGLSGLRSIRTISPESQEYVFFLSDKGQICSWTEGNGARVLADQNGSGLALEFCRRKNGESFFVASGEDNYLRIWNTETDLKALKFGGGVKGSRASFYRVSWDFERDGIWCIENSGFREKGDDVELVKGSSVVFRNADDGQVQHHTSLHRLPISSMAVKGTMLVTGSRDGVIRFFEFDK